MWLFSKLPYPLKLQKTQGSITFRACRELGNYVYTGGGIAAVRQEHLGKFLT